MSNYRGVVTSPEAHFYAPTMSPIFKTREGHSFKHSRNNLFPPKQRPLSNVSEGEEVPIVLSAVEDQIDTMITEISAPAARSVHFRPGILSAQDTENKSTLVLPPHHPTFGNQQQARGTAPNQWQNSSLNLLTQEPEDSYTSVRYPAFTPPAEGIPPFLFPEPRKEYHAPVATVTNLLQDVLGVMNTIMSEQDRVQEENQMLLELAELAAIMQEEAEALIEMVDLVDEYVEEVDKAVEIDELEAWLESLERKQSPLPFRRTIHDREDSGVSMGDETDSGLSISDEIDKRKGTRRLRSSHPPPPDDLSGRRSIVSMSESRRLTKADEVQRRPTTHRPKKGIGTRNPHFRDSALDLLSPVVQKR